MLTAEKANKITLLNKYKIEFKKQLELNCILNQVKKLLKKEYPVLR